jgi:cytochrome c-type biogenesis protein CcmH/NrfF
VARLLVVVPRQQVVAAVILWAAPRQTLVVGLLAVVRRRAAWVLEVPENPRDAVAENQRAVALPLVVAIPVPPIPR